MVDLIILWNNRNVVDFTAFSPSIIAFILTILEATISHTCYIVEQLFLSIILNIEVQWFRTLLVTACCTMPPSNIWNIIGIYCRYYIYGGIPFIGLPRINVEMQIYCIMYLIYICSIRNKKLHVNDLETNEVVHDNTLCFYSQNIYFSMIWEGTQYIAFWVTFLHLHSDAIYQPLKFSGFTEDFWQAIATFP